MLHRFALLLPLTALALGACRPRTYNTSSIKTLEPMVAVSSVEVSDFKLSFAAKNNISYKITKEIVNSTTEENRNYIIKISFGKITQAQYQLLQENYGGQGLVAYDANRNYEIEDFLPPKMQALLNHWLLPSMQADARIPTEWGDEDLIGSGYPVNSGVGMNCWSTAYEVLRDLGKPFAAITGKFFYFGPSRAGELLWINDALQVSKTPLKRDFWDAPKTVERNSGRKLGDLLYITTQNSFVGPAHVALWVDDDLYFEKTNYSGEDPIRLAFYKDVIKPYIAQDDKDLPMEMSFVRYKSATQVKFPEPESMAGKPAYADPIKVSLPEDVKKSVIFTLDITEDGDRLGMFGAYRILSFPIVQDQTSKRAIYAGATELKNFVVSDTACSAEVYESNKYKLTPSMQLYVYNAKGKELMRLAGKKVNYKTSNGDFLIDFAYEKKKISIYNAQMGEARILSISHPGVDNMIPLSCVEGDQTIAKLK